MNKRNLIFAILIALILIVGVFALFKFVILKDNVSDTPINEILPEENEKTENKITGNYSCDNNGFAYELKMLEDKTFKLALKNNDMYAAYTGTYEKNGNNINLLINRVYSDNSYKDINVKLDLEYTESKKIKMVSSEVPALSNITEFELLENTAELPLIKQIDTYVDYDKMNVIGKYSAKRTLQYVDGVKEYKVELELYKDNTFKLVLEPSKDDNNLYTKYAGKFVVENSKNVILNIHENIYMKLEVQENKSLKTISCDVPMLSIIEKFEKLDDNYEMEIINKI